MLRIKRIPVGAMSVNCYVIFNEKGNAIVVDPATNCETLFRYIANNNLNVQTLILTHGHFDHIQEVEQVIEKYHCSLFIHTEDVEMLTDPDKNVSRMIGKCIIVKTKPTRLLQDKDVINLDDDQIQVIHTPGHTPGGICLLCPDFVLVGDTLFKGSYGRTDFPRGNQKRLFESIRTKLLVLDEQLTVYPGHGDSTTIKEEKQHW